MKASVLPWFMLALGLSAAPAHAGTEPVAEGLHRCSHETDERQRLACFDALVTTLPQINTDQFGMTADIARKRESSPETKGNKANSSEVKIDSETLTGKIAGLQEASRGQWIFNLDNGQLWIQVEPRSNIHFGVGESVRLEHGAMGSLWLAADHHRKTKVKRIQ